MVNEIQSWPALNSPYTYLHKLFADPPIFVVSAGLLLDSGVKLALKTAQGRDCFIVVQPSWDLHLQAGHIASYIHATKLKNHSVQFVVICPTPQEVHLLNALGVDALHVHKNAFIDEKIFHPKLGIKKQYDAVHIASVEKFKRHSLAWNIRNIAVITYGYQAVIDLSELQGYKYLAFGNFKISNEGSTLEAPLSPINVNEIICLSNCGLILSEEEGTNNASTEYLLSGIPVVSTPSRGGRNELFDPRHVYIAKPCSDSIEAAVEYFRNNHLDPFEIRESVLIKIREHRVRFLNWLCQASKQDLYLHADKNFWIPSFVNKLRMTIPITKDLIEL